jgi:hypothetical protein
LLCVGRENYCHPVIMAARTQLDGGDGVYIVVPPFKHVRVQVLFPRWSVTQETVGILLFLKTKQNRNAMQCNETKRNETKI